MRIEKVAGATLVSPSPITAAKLSISDCVTVTKSAPAKVRPSGP